jgi:hypothetical protein
MLYRFQKHKVQLSEIMERAAPRGVLLIGKYKGVLKFIKEKNSRRNFNFSYFKNTF